MNGRSIAGHITALTVVLIGALIGCGVAPTPAPTPDPEGNGDPILSKMPTGALLERVTMPFTRTGNRADTAPEVKLSFAKGMNRESVESAVNLYPAEITRNTGTPKRLQVKAICDGGWQIRNPNSSAVSFNWSISKSVERGEGMVAANGEQLLYTTRGLKQLRLSVNGVLQTRVLSVSSACAKTLEFIWSEDNKSVTVRSLKALGSDALTISLSTAAFSSDGVRMVEPSSETLVPEQIIQANQPIALQFSQGVNRVTLESSLKIYQGKFDSYDALEATAPRVTNACDGSYTVKNPSSSALSFSWSIEGSSEKGAGNVAALSETKVTPSSNARAIKVFTDKGINVTRSLEESSACNISFSSVWDASSAGVKLTASSVWKLGSFTVMGSAVNDAGAKIARDRLSVVHIVSDDSSVNPNPNPDPVISPQDDPIRAELSANAFLPLVTAGEPSTFDGGDSGGDPTRFTWQFGDGERLTGASVDKTFTDPGVYPVTLTVANDAGISDSVTSNITVTKALDQAVLEANLTGGNDTVSFDLGAPIPGLQYRWEFLDTSDSRATPILRDGSRVTQRLPKLGTYTVTAQVLDYRDQLAEGRSAQGKRDGNPTDPEDQFDRSLYRAQSWMTRWELRPQAQIKAISSNVAPGGWREALFGTITRASPSYTVRFNAGDSVGTDLQYAWKICRIIEDGCNPIATLTGATPSYNFTQTGEYGIALRITDKYEQIDDAQSYVMVKNGDAHFIIPRLDFPTSSEYERLMGGQNSSPEAPPAPPPPPPAAPPPPPPPDAPPPPPTDSAVYYDSYFPFVLHRSVKLNRATTRWNDWSNGNNFKSQLCKSVKAFYTNDNRLDNDEVFPVLFPDAVVVPGEPVYVYSPVFGYYVISNPPSILDESNCVMASVRNENVPSMGSRSDAALTITGNWVQRTYFDVPYDFRVPKVMLSVLPDELIPGDSNTADPSTLMVEENVASVNGKDELVLSVRMRQSEVDRTDGNLEFDVPVYAVDRAGRRMLNTNGMFFAGFDGINSDCGDCVMRNGKAYVRVRLNPRAYGVESGQTLNLSTLVLSSDDQRCDTLNASSAISQKTRGGLFGCSLIRVDSAAPLGEEVAPRLNYPIIENSARFFGVMLYGDQADSVRQFREFMTKGVYTAVWDYVLDTMPVIGAIRLILRGGAGLVAGITQFFELAQSCAATGQPDPTLPPPPVLGNSGPPQCDVLTFLTLGADVLQQAGLAAMGSVGFGVETSFYFNKGMSIYQNSKLGRIVDAKLPFSAGTTRAAGSLAKLLQSDIRGLLSSGARTFSDVASTLKQRYGNLLKKMDRCGTACDEITNGYIENYKRAGRTTKQAAERLESLARGCGNSFAANTLIWTSLGLLPISQALAADGTGYREAKSITQAWSYNESTQRLELNQVNHVFIHEDEKITTLVIRDQLTKKLETITTTPEHPFYTRANQTYLELKRVPSTSFTWINAEDLKPGDAVWQAKNSAGVVEQVKTVARDQVMYNLEVQRAHTYFVGASKWLVHNASRPWLPCTGSLGSVGTASAEAALLAEKANLVLETLPRTPFVRDVTVAVGRDSVTGKLFVTACCRADTLRIMDQMKQTFRDVLGEDFILQDQYRYAPNFIKKSPLYRYNYHSERVLFLQGADKIGISRQKGLCLTCQKLFDKSLFQSFPELEVAVYAK